MQFLSKDSCYWESYHGIQCAHVLVLKWLQTSCASRDKTFNSTKYLVSKTCLCFHSCASLALGWYSCSWGRVTICPAEPIHYLKPHGNTLCWNSSPVCTTVKLHRRAMARKAAGTWGKRRGRAVPWSGTGVSVQSGLIVQLCNLTAGCLLDVSSPGSERDFMDRFSWINCLIGLSNCWNSLLQ